MAETFTFEEATKIPKRKAETFTFEEAVQPKKATDPFGRGEKEMGERDAVLTRMGKIGRGMLDPFDGGAQLITKMLPDSVVGAGNQLNNWLAEKTGLVGALPPGGIDQQVREKERAYQQQRKASGDEGFDGYRLLGNVVSPANLALAAKLPQAATLAGRIAVGAGGGAASGALSPVTEGEFSKEKIKQIGIGAAAGGAVPALAGAVSRVISPNATRNPDLQLLMDEGVRPTVGQRLGGRWNALEEKAQSIPILGDSISNARRLANTQLETAAHNRALAPIGESLPAGVAGRDAITHTEARLRDSYDKVLNKIGAISPDGQFNQNISSLQTMVNGLVMPRAEKAKFASALNDVRQSIDANGVITSDAFKALESSLGTDARKLAASTNIYEGKISPAVKQLQAELRDMLTRQAGNHAADLRATNQGWANFKRVQNAAGKIGAEDGNFTPAQLQNAVRSLDKSKDKAAFSRGGALMQDLSDAGKSVIGSKVPNSFTTDRALIAGGALGSYLLNPAIPAGLLGGAAAYLPTMQNALGAAITSRPQNAQAIGNAFSKYSSGLVPLGAQLGLGFYD